MNRRMRWGAGAVLAGSLAVGPVATLASAAEPTPPPRDISQFACPQDEVPDGGFVDSAGTFELAIDCLKWYGVTSGGPQGLPQDQYGPSLTVSRAQMATFLTRVFDYVDPDRLAPYDGQNRFVDVALDDPHVASINRLAAAGIVSGGAGGGAADTYSPNQDVGRDQMASFIARLLGNLLEANLCVSTHDYFDDDAANTHETCIDGLAELAIVQGDGAGSYGPGNPVTRAQMAAFLMRGMDLLVEQELASTPT